MSAEIAYVLQWWLDRATQADPTRGIVLTPGELAVFVNVAEAAQNVVYDFDLAQPITFGEIELVNALARLAAPGEDLNTRNSPDGLA